MSFDPEFENDPFGKGARKGARPRSLAALVSFAALAAVMATPFLFSDLLAPTQPAEPASVATPAPIESAPSPTSAMATPSGPLPYHLIVNRETGQCLDVPYGGTQPRTRIEQFPVNGGGNQLWRLEPVPSDGVRIVNRQSELCLDIPFGTREPHVAVEQYPINGGSNQGWRLEPVGDQWYRIVNQHTGQCLEVASGSSERRAAIEQAPPGDSPYQHWRPIAVQ